MRSRPRGVFAVLIGTLALVAADCTCDTSKPEAPGFGASRALPKPVTLSVADVAGGAVRTWRAIRRSGYVRILTLGAAAGVTSHAAATADNRAELEAWARAQQLGLRWVQVAQPEQRLSALRAGKGDFIGDRLPGSAAPPGIQATRSVQSGTPPQAWWVPRRAPNLRDALNQWIYQRRLTQHRRSVYGGDVPDIRARDALRVGMLNNGVAYFIYRGQEVGFQYELAALLAARLDVRLEAVVPERPGRMLSLLLEGRADVVPWSVQEGRALPDGVRVTEPFIFADAVLVQRMDDAPVESVAQLAGRTVWARATSSYWPLLEQLREQVPELRVRAASERTETEALIARVGSGDIDLTVSNTALLEMERTYRDDVQGTLVLARQRGLAYAVRAESSELFERLQRFVREEPDKPAYKRLHNKYFASPDRMAQVGSEQAAVSGVLSPYDALAKRFGKAYGIDWRLILAQMYQESRFDPEATSWAGARGLMQLMPATARELGVRNILDPEENVRAGVRYLAELIERFDKSLPMRQRVRFALASYNAGYQHVLDAREIAADIGLSPNRWFGHVEKAIRLLSKPRYYRGVSHGYCRGREPVQYVSRIQSKYDAYVTLAPRDAPKGLGDARR